MIKSLRKSMRMRIMVYSAVIVLISVIISSAVSVFTIVNDYLTEKQSELKSVSVLLGEIGRAHV